MNERKKIEDSGELVDKIRAKQRNTVWPDTLRNNQSVDTFFWKGSKKPSRVQRIGAVLFGLTLICCALGFANAFAHSLWGLLSFGLLYLGARVLGNSLPKNSKRNR